MVYIQLVPACITHPYKSGLLRHGNRAAFLSSEPEHRMVLVMASSHLWEDGQHLSQKKKNPKKPRAAQA